MQMKMIIIGAFCFSAGVVFGMQSSVPFINADDVHDLGITGLGVTVAIIDTGIYYDHPGLAGSIAPGGISIINGVEIHDGGEDIYGYGHGTYMSLIITEQIGVAHDARILPIRVHGSSGGANPNDVIQAIYYVINRRASDPSIRVINRSAGSGSYPCHCDEFWSAYQQAISDALNSGIVTFAATGNEEECGGICMPACFSSAVKVAANYDANYGYTNLGDCGDYAQPYRVVCFSNIAEECEYLIAAPGYDITVGGFSGDGTSQATAHCSGVAALMFDKSGACGSITADTVRSFIYDTATEYIWAYPHCELIPQPRHVNALAAVNVVEAGPCSELFGDMDCDEIFTPSDFDYFAVCMTGPDTDPIGGGCVCADLPASPPDGDVDLHDFISFQRAYSGGGGSTATVTLNLTSPSAGQIVEPGETVYWSVLATVSQGDNAGLAAISVDMVQDAGNRRFFDIPPATVVGTGMEGFNAPEGISNPPTEVAGSGYGGTPFGPAGAKNLYQIGGAQNTFGQEGYTGVGADFNVDPYVGQTGPQVIAEGSFAAPTAADTYVFRIENALANVLNLAEPPPSPPDSWPVSSANVFLDSSSFTVIVPYDIVRLDFDGDRDVDQDDFAHMQLCYSPEEILVGCEDANPDADTTIQMDDMWLFDHCASAPGIVADSTCGDCNDNGIHDAAEDFNGDSEPDGDYDLDGIEVRGRPLCSPLKGVTTDCDDNCPCVANADQADSDKDEIGDVCDSQPLGGGGEGGEGAGCQGSEMLVSAGEESYEPYVMAWFVDRQMGESDVKLSAGGETVSLNLVLDSEVPVSGFEGVISVSTAGDDDVRDRVSGGDAADGCQVGSLSVTYITSGYMPNADAKLTVCDMHIPGSDSQAESEADVQEPITLSTSDFGFDVGLNALSMLEAPEEWVFSVAIDPATIDLPAEANCADIWAQMFSNKPELYLDALSAGQTVVARISLQFAAQGTYNVSFTEGIATAATGQQATITPGPDLEITIPAD